MAGFVSFSLSLLVMLLFAAATMRRSGLLMNVSFAAMILSGLINWYQFVFPLGLEPLFFIGTAVTVLAISCFFYAVYTFYPPQPEAAQASDSE